MIEKDLLMNWNALHYLRSALHSPEFNSVRHDMIDVPDFIKVLE